MIFKYILFLVVLTFAACVKIEPGLNVKIIGHAGGGLNKTYALYAPNSYKSIENALITGVDGVEVDLQVSFDSVGFLMHDISSGELDGKLIHQVYSNELSAYNLTQLKDLKPLLLASQREIYIDLKMDVNQMDLLIHFPKIRKVLADFQEGLDSTKLFVISSNANYLNQLQNLNYHLIYSSTDFNEQINTAINNQFDGLFLAEENYNLNAIQICKENNLQVGVLNQGDYRALVKDYNLNPDFIILDNIHNGLMLKK